MKAYSTVNYSVIEKNGLWYRATSNKKSYWPDKAYNTKDEATEEVLIIMLNDAQFRMDNIIRQLGKHGWGEGDKNIGDLLS